MVAPLMVVMVVVCNVSVTQWSGGRGLHIGHNLKQQPDFKNGPFWGGGVGGGGGARSCEVFCGSLLTHTATPCTVAAAPSVLVMFDKPSPSV